MNRFALAAVVLLVSTVSFAQAPAQGSQAASATSSSGAGVFRATDAAGDKGTGAPAAMGGQQPTPVIGLGKEYLVGPNDLLEIEVLNLENGKRTVRVNAAGSITLPLIGVVRVAGLTQQQVESHIAEMYGEKYLQDPQVSVFIKEFTTERITIEGAVAKPGIYPLVGEVTLLRALALAGGFGQIANPKEVKVFRKGERGQPQVATFNVENIRSGKDADPEIRGEDLIVVQRDSTRALLKDSVFRDIIDSINPFRVFMQ